MIPVFLTGRQALNCYFDFSLTAPSQSVAELLELTTSDNAGGVSNSTYRTFLQTSLLKLRSITTLYYISQLCKTVNHPTDDVSVDSVQQGSLSFPFARGTVTNNLQVTYLDDEFHTVYKFHTWWQSLPYGPRVSGAGSALDFNKVYGHKPTAMYPLGAFCLAANHSYTFPIVAPSGNISTGVTTSIPTSSEALKNQALNTSHTIRWDAPTQTDYYPRLYPMNISRVTSDKSDAQISSVTVTYLRIPYLTYSLPVTSMDSKAKTLEMSASYKYVAKIQ